MKGIALAGLALLTACVEPAPETPAAPAIALWDESSGSLPPEFAWDFRVIFTADQMVTAEYCRGYATTAPGCAKSTAPLTAEQFSALQAQLAPMVADMAARMPREAIVAPVGSPATFATLYQDGTALNLPAYPTAADAARVAAAISLLKSFTPEGLVDKAKSRAR